MLIQLNATLRGRFGLRDVPVDLPEGSTVRDALNLLQASMPDLYAALVDENGQVRDDIFMLRNGRNIRFLEGLDTPLSTNDTINCFPNMGAQRVFARD